MLLILKDGKLLVFYSLEIFADNILSIDSRDIKTLRLDEPCYDESNES